MNSIASLQRRPLDINIKINLLLSAILKIPLTSMIYWVSWDLGWERVRKHMDEGE